MAGFLTNLGLAAGRNLLYGQEFQEKQEDIQLKKQQLQMGQLAMQQAQRQQQTQQAVGSFLASEQAKDQATITDPAKSAQMYEKAAALALQSGDFASANTMSEIAKGKLNEAKEQMQVQAQQQQVKKEALASAADAYATNPTADGAKDLMRKAVDAGVNPTSIPMPGTPQFASWVNAQQLASKTAAERADFLEKVQENRTKMAIEQQNHADNVALRRESMQQTAMLRESMLSLERERLDIAKAKAAAPAKESAQAQAANNAIIGSASEGLRGLRVVGALDSDQTAGPFQGLANGTILDAVAKTGGNILTSEDQQIYHTATAGLGLELARTMTLGGGRGANQATIDELQNVVTAHPGDTKATALFKYSNAASIIKNRLESMPTPGNKEQADKRQKLLDDLNKIPEPQQILKVVKDPKLRAKMLASQESMSTAMDKVGAETGLPGTPDAGAGTAAPPLPAGWSVKEH